MRRVEKVRREIVGVKGDVTLVSRMERGYEVVVEGQAYVAGIVLRTLGRNVWDGDANRAG